MKFRVAREVLAEAVAWTARSLPPRPSVPVLAGILLEVEGSQLSVSGFDYEVSARSEIDVQSSEGGRALVPGRLLAEITRALPPHQVDVVAEGARLSIRDRKSTRLNSSHANISYAVFCLKKKKKIFTIITNSSSTFITI